jgi:hypothetical protein
MGKSTEPHLNKAEELKGKINKHIKRLQGKGPFVAACLGLLMVSVSLLIPPLAPVTAVLAGGLIGYSAVALINNVYQATKISGYKNELKNEKAKEAAPIKADDDLSKNMGLSPTAPTVSPKVQSTVSVDVPVTPPIVATATGLPPLPPITKLPPPPPVWKPEESNKVTAKAPTVLPPEPAPLSPQMKVFAAKLEALHTRKQPQEQHSIPSPTKTTAHMTTGFEQQKAKAKEATTVKATVTASAPEAKKDNKRLGG